MAIFLITPLAFNAETIATVVEGALPERDQFKLSGKAGWLVSFPGTSVELSNKLGITGQPEGSPPAVSAVLITSVGAYYGRGQADMWEWLKTRMEAAA